MEWTDIRLTVAKADADNAEAVATMIAEGGIYIEDYSDIEQQVAEIAHVDLIEQELLDKPRDTVIIHMYLEPGAGSDASAGKTTAVKDGDEYVLNGRKCFITNGGVASFYCVTAMTDKSKGVKGISMFLIDAGTPGLSTGHEENKMGIRTSNTCDVVLEDCRIPAANLIGEEGKGFGIAMKTLDQARAWMGCVATGIAQRGINEAVAYGKERIQFGKPIIKNQALQFKVADMEIKTETARQMVAHALTKMDMGLPYTKESAIAKCYASDIAMEVASEAIQMFGGYGYSREYPVEKLLRDAKIFQIFEGTNEVQRIVVANNVIGK